MRILKETIHLSLRRPTSGDALILKDLWRNEKVREFLGGILPDELITEKIKELQNHWDCYGFGLWSVWRKIPERLIGPVRPASQPRWLRAFLSIFPGILGTRIGEGSSTHKS